MSRWPKARGDARELPTTGREGGAFGPRGLRCPLALLRPLWRPCARMCSAHGPLLGLTAYRSCLGFVFPPSVSRERKKKNPKVTLGRVKQVAYVTKLRAVPTLVPALVNELDVQRPRMGMACRHGSSAHVSSSPDPNIESPGIGPASTEVPREQTDRFSVPTLVEPSCNTHRSGQHRL